VSTPGAVREGIADRNHVGDLEDNKKPMVYFDDGEE